LGVRTAQRVPAMLSTRAYRRRWKCWLPSTRSRCISGSEANGRKSLPYPRLPGAQANRPHENDSLRVVLRHLIYAIGGEGGTRCVDTGTHEGPVRDSSSNSSLSNSFILTAWGAQHVPLAQNSPSALRMQFLRAAAPYDHHFECVDQRFSTGWPRCRVGTQNRCSCGIGAP